MRPSYRRSSPASPAKAAQDFSSAQGDFFQQLEALAVLTSKNAPALDIGPELLGAINTALREARARGLSRDRIVDRMNACMPERERPVTLRQLNSWTATSKEFHPFPVDCLAAFCWATGSDEPLRVLVRAVGFDLVDAREQVAKELGEAQVAIARLRRKSGELTKRLGA